MPARGSGRSSSRCTIVSGCTRRWPTGRPPSSKQTCNSLPPPRDGRKLLRSQPVPSFVSHTRGALHGRTQPRPVARQDLDRGSTGRERAAKKIQAIYRGKWDGITMQALATARERPPAQKQGITGKKQRKKQGAEQWKQADIRARADASPGHIDTPQKQIARRREAPSAHIQD